MEANVEIAFGAAAQQAGRRCFDQILAGQFGAVGGEEQAPAHQHAEALGITIVAGLDQLAFGAAAQGQRHFLHPGGQRAIIADAGGIGVSNHQGRMSGGGGQA